MAKAHRVRDVAAPRFDRELSGSGIFGVAYGGLSGDGDVKMVANLGACQKAAFTAFDEFIGKDGQYVRLGHITGKQAYEAMLSVEGQFASWSSAVNGACLDLTAKPEGMPTLRVGVFRCFQGWEDPPGVKWPTAWWVPHEVRLPIRMPRKVFDDGKMGYR